MLGEPTYSVDPASLLGKEVETFDLGASATGTVLAVDETAVRGRGGHDIASQVEPGYRWSTGSSNVEPSPGVVESGVITFPVTVTAREVLQVDPAAVEAEIRGKSQGRDRPSSPRYGQSSCPCGPIGSARSRRSTARRRAVGGARRSRDRRSSGSTSGSVGSAWRSPTARASVRGR